MKAVSDKSTMETSFDMRRNQGVEGRTERDDCEWGQSAPKNRPKEDGVQTCDPSRWKITKGIEREEKPTKTRRKR